MGEENKYNIYYFYPYLFKTGIDDYIENGHVKFMPTISYIKKNSVDFQNIEKKSFFTNDLITVFDKNTKLDSLYNMYVKTKKPTKKVITKFHYNDHIAKMVNYYGNLVLEEYIISMIINILCDEKENDNMILILNNYSKSLIDKIARLYLNYNKNIIGFLSYDNIDFSSNSLSLQNLLLRVDYEQINTFNSNHIIIHPLDSQNEQIIRSRIEPNDFRESIDEGVFVRHIFGQARVNYRIQLMNQATYSCFSNDSENFESKLQNVIELISDKDQVVKKEGNKIHDFIFELWKDLDDYRLKIVKKIFEDELEKDSRG